MFGGMIVVKEGRLEDGVWNGVVDKEEDASPPLVVPGRSVRIEEKLGKSLNFEWEESLVSWRAAILILWERRKLESSW